MNNKKSKAIRNQTTSILVEWMHSLLSEEEALKITSSNIYQYLPKQKYYVTRKTTYLNSYHPKWVTKHIKQLLRINPKLKINKIDLNVIKEKIGS